MKKLICAIALSMVFAVNAANDLLKYMPKNNKILVILDVQKSLTIPMVAEGLESANQDPRIQKFMKATGFRVESCDKVMISMDVDVVSGQPKEESLVMALGTLEAIDLSKLLGEGAKADKSFTYNKLGYKGKEMFVIEQLVPSQMNHKLAMMNISPKTIISGDLKAVKSLVDSLGSNNNMTANAAMMNLVKKSKGVFSFLVDSSQQPQPAAGQQGNPLSSVKAIALSGDMLSAGLEVSLIAECFKSEQAAGLMAMYNMFVAPSLQAPQSPIKPNELKVNADGALISAQLNLSKERLAEIKKQFEVMQQMQQAPAAQIPQK